MNTKRMATRKPGALIGLVTSLCLLASVTACARRGEERPETKAPEAARPSNAGVRVDLPFDLVRAGFASPDMLYAPFIFWFWDEPLNTPKMAEMSRVMTSVGYNPGYAHARRSMVGTPDLPDGEWLGDKWFEAFDAALGEAERGKAYLGYCDEYWWPSFQANGRILKARPELEAKSLNWQTFDVKGGEDVAVPACYFAVAAERAEAQTKDGPALIRSSTLRVIGSGAAFTWKAPASGGWRVYAFNLYHHPGADGGKVNYIDSRLAPAFIATALEPYAARLAGKLGHSVPGDFIDNEGDYGWSLAWSDTLDARYKERYRRDIRLWLPLAVDRDAEGVYARARWEWFDLVSDIYAETFRAVTDWHEARGMSTTAHYWEEGLQPQVNAVGDHLKMLRALTMPGQDCLGRKPLRVHDFKEIESVAEFGNVRAATELMGAGAFEGTPWGTFNPPFLKQAANAVMAWGMSHVIPHAVFATRKLEGNPWPPDWYSENPMFPYLRLWNDFVRRASYVNSMGRAVPDVLLYNPIESAWIEADAALLDAAMWKFDEKARAGARINAIDKIYSQAIDELTAARVEFLVGDRFYLGKMKAEKGTLAFEDLRFKTVILPAVDILPLAAARKIVDLAKSGGHVYALGGLPKASAEKGMGDPEMKALMDSLRALPSFKACAEDGLGKELAASAPGLESPVRFLSGAFPMLQHRRRIDGRDFFWLVNNAEEPRACELSIAGVKGAASVWDCETGEIRPVGSWDENGTSTVSLAFKPYEAFWLVFDPGAPALGGPIEGPPQVQVVAVVPGPWTVAYDASIQPQMEFPMTPPAVFVQGVEKPLEDWKSWGLEKFSGLLDYTAKLTIAKPGADFKLDLGRVAYAAEVWVNGKPCGVRLWGPHIYAVGDALKPGPNEVRVRVANLINNSYGEIAPSGLFGPVRLVR